MTAPRRIVATLVRSSGALLSGCGGGTPAAEPTPKMPPASSSSPTEGSTPDEPVEPTPPPEMNGTGVKAAEAFVEYYFALWDYALLDGDTATMEEVAFKTCQPCAAVAGAISDTHENGGSVEGGTHVVRDVKLSERTGVDGIRLYAGNALVDVTAQVIDRSGLKGLDGSYAEGSDTYQLVVIHDKRGWHMSEWTSD